MTNERELIDLDRFDLEAGKFNDLNRFRDTF